MVGLSAGIAAYLLPSHALAQIANGPARALREMQIHRLPQLGLEVWVENQPAWETHLSHADGRPSFVAEAPIGHHPPAVMIYASWPDRRVASRLLATMAVTAIRRASRNFGLGLAQSRGLSIQLAAYGDLEGYQADFTGTVQGIDMDVRLFVGHTPGRFPVVLTLYTLEGKRGGLSEHIRRAWGNLKYLRHAAQ